MPWPPRGLDYEKPDEQEILDPQIPCLLSIAEGMFFVKGFARFGLTGGTLR
jgi:hypothetical protein